MEQYLLSSVRSRHKTERSKAVATIDHHRRTKPSVFVCGHGTRDSRCGVLGPILQQQFGALGLSKGKSGSFAPFTVDLISHVGGHAWAGNVLIHIPPRRHLADGTLSPLAGKGVWYGRVEPKHVEGIIEETILKGRVIEELLRGVHGGEDHELMYN